MKTLALLSALLAASAAVEAAPPAWSWAHPSPQGYGYHAVIHDGSRFLAFGSNGASAASVDGLAWTSIPREDRLYVGAVARGPEGYVAMGLMGAFLTSPDGKTWNVEALLPAVGLEGVAYGAGKFVAVGGEGEIFTSADGIVWAPQQGAGVEWQQAVLRTDSLFLSCGDSARVQYSPDGVQWTRAVTPPALKSNCKALAQGGGKVVAVTDQYDVLFSRDGGRNWSAAAIPRFGNFTGVAYGNGRFVAAGRGGDMAVSEDGETWKQVYRDFEEHYQALAFGGGKFVAVGDNGAIAVSSDGLAWNQLHPWSTWRLGDPIFGHGRFMIPTTEDSLIVSEDGKSFRTVPLPDSFRVQKIEPVENGYLGVGAGGAFLSSPDGSAWTTFPRISRWAVPAGAFGKGLYVAPGGSGAIHVSEGPSASWRSVASGTLATFRDAVFAEGRFVAVGDSGIILHSEDGLAWTKAASPIKTGLEQVIYGAGRFLAAGPPDTLLTSEDGITWTARMIPFGHTRVMSHAGGYFRMATHGRAWDAANWWCVSKDGLNWSRERFPDDLPVYGLAYGADRYVMAGHFGHILTAGADPSPVRRDGKSSRDVRKAGISAPRGGPVWILDDRGLPVSDAAGRKAPGFTR